MKRKNHAAKGKHELSRFSFPKLLRNAYCILLCIICLITFTEAYFGKQVCNNGNVIATAEYGFHVTVKVVNPVSMVSLTESSDIVVEPVDEKWHLEKDNLYQVEIEATGTASVGYAEVRLPNGTVNTEPIGQGTPFVFQIEVTGDDFDLEISACWGVPKSAEVIIKNNSEDVLEVILETTAFNEALAEGPVEKSGATPTEESAEASAEEITKKEI